MARREKVNCVVAATIALLLMTHSIDRSEAKRAWSGSNNRKTSSGGGTSRNPSSSNSGHVTRPTYSNSGSNSHADAAKLSYPNYNSQPNHAAGAGSGTQNAAPIGWNVPKQQGPPPVYSATNPAGGAKTNMHEPPPVYRAPNNAAPPSYGASNVHTPITATNTHGVQSSYPSHGVPPGATYHSPGALPAGATYYPGGHMPAGGGYYPGGGHYPAAGGAYPGGGMPAGATYLPAGASLPAGATYYAQPPQSSSGLGFGSGLAAGAIGGALLGHALTPTNTRVVESAPAGNAGSGGEDKIIIINNGPPGSVQATTAGTGTTLITTNGVSAMNGTEGAPAGTPAAAGSDPAVPNVPLAAMQEPPPAPAAPGAAPPAPGGEQPPAGGIICVPVRVNETDPADNSKMIEVEKIACYPAPPPPPPAAADTNNTAPAMGAGDGNVSLAPMSPMPGGNTQQNPTQSPLLPENASVRTAGSNAAALHFYFAPLFSALLLAFVGLRQ